jgi:hypothetical protein
MKFVLQTERSVYGDVYKTALEELGFKFEKYGDRWLIEWGVNPEIEISTLEELMQFSDKHGPIVIDAAGITICDDVMEM